MTEEREHYWQDQIKKLKALPENQHCADCLSTETEWASINLGIFVCINCSGVHRSLGVHISKVRSIQLDESVWKKEIYEYMAERGNHRANCYWECNAFPFEKPLAQDPYHFRKEYIENKYSKKKYVPSASNLDYRLEREFSIETVNYRGMVTKQGGNRKNWRKRYAILTGNVLSYFVDEYDSYPKGSLELDATCKILFVDESVVGKKNCFTIETKERNYFIYCEKEEQTAKWVYALRAAVYFKNLKDVLNDPRNFLKGGENQNIEKSGFLKKQGGGWTSIKKRYFRLRGTKLSYYKSEKELEPIDSIDLRGVKVSEGIQNPKEKKNQYSIMLQTSSRQYFFYAENEAEQKSWIAALQSVTNTVSDLQLVQAKNIAIHNLILNRMVQGKDKKVPIEEKASPHSPLIWRSQSFHRSRPLDVEFINQVEKCFGAHALGDRSMSQKLPSDMNKLSREDFSRTRTISLRSSVESVKQSDMRQVSFATKPEVVNALKSIDTSSRNSMPVMPSNNTDLETIKQKERVECLEEFSQVSINTKGNRLLGKNLDSKSVMINNKTLPQPSPQSDDSEGDMEDLNALILNPYGTTETSTNLQPVSAIESLPETETKTTITESATKMEPLTAKQSTTEVNHNVIDEHTEIELSTAAVTITEPLSKVESDETEKIQVVQLRLMDDSNDLEEEGGEEQDEETEDEEDTPIILNTFEELSVEEKRKSSASLTATEEEHMKVYEDNGIIMCNFTTEQIIDSSSGDANQTAIVRKHNVVLPDKSQSKQPGGMTSFRKMHMYVQPILEAHNVPVMD